MADPRARFVITAEDKASRALKKISGEAKGLSSTFKALAVALPVGALVAFTKNSIDAADEINKISQRLGASTEALSQYKFVADQTGVSFKTLTMGWQRMTRRISEAAQGTGEAKNALAELGLDVEKLNKLKPEDQFEVLADAIMKVEAPADRVRLAMKLFDSEGVALLQTMEGGSEKVRALREEFNKMGGTLTKEAAESASKAKSAIDKLGKSGEAAGVLLVNTMGPAIEAVANWLQSDLPGAVQVAVNAFDDLQIFIAESGHFITGALAGIEYALSDAAAAAGFDQLARALRTAGDDYADFANNYEKVTIRLQRAKLEIPEIGGNAVTGAGQYSDIFDEDIAGASLVEKLAARQACQMLRRNLTSYWKRAVRLLSLCVHLRKHTQHRLNGLTGLLMLVQ